MGYTAFFMTVVWCFFQTSLSAAPAPAPAPVLIDSVNIDLRDDNGGSLLALLELTDVDSPVQQTEKFCLLYFLKEEQCSVLTEWAVTAYNLFQEERRAELSAEGTKTVVEQARSATVIASVPVVLVSPEGDSLEGEFSLHTAPDPTAQGENENHAAAAATEAAADTDTGNYNFC